MGLIHVRDPVHNYISFEEHSLLGDLVDTFEFQRLRGIRQLGVSYLVYPGAEHSRFSHALGVSHLSGRMYDTLVGPESDADDRELVVIAGLLHDLGHTPFSHLFERFFTPDLSHEEWGARIIRDGETEINELIDESGYSIDEIDGLIRGRPTQPRFLQMIVSSQLDADRFDYLLRDAHYTGAPEGNFDLERILRVIGLDEHDRMRVLQKGRHSVEGYLTSRYHMYNQVYLHPTTVCFEFLLKAILRRAADLAGDGREPDGEIFEGVSLASDNDPTVNEFLSSSDWPILNCVRLWRRSGDDILADLCNRFLSRNRIFKPVKQVRLTVDSLWGKEDQMRGIIQAHGLEPKYYLHVRGDQVKEAYKPYSPQREDQENAIFLESEEEISEAFPNLKGLMIGPHPFVCVPEECRDEVAALFP